MKKYLVRKGLSVGVVLSLVFLIFTVLLPSTTAVKVSAGIPSISPANVGMTMFFEDVNFIIRSAEAIPVNFLTFEIFDSTTNHRVAWVRFTVMGVEMSENPPRAFTVVNVTDTSNLLHQCRGDYYGYDEQTGYNITGFHHGFGYGYRYGKSDLLIVYNISYKTKKPGTYYAKLFVKATKYTFASEKTAFFRVLPQTPFSNSVDIKPGCWPNQLNTWDHGCIHNAILGTDTLDVRTIHLGTIALTVGREKNKPLGWLAVSGYLNQ